MITKIFVKNALPEMTATGDQSARGHRGLGDRAPAGRLAKGVAKVAKGPGLTCTAAVRAAAPPAALVSQQGFGTQTLLRVTTGRRGIHFRDVFLT